MIYRDFVEPFGMIAVQAMQRALPAIVSRRCGVSELITHGKDGFILENYLDSNELASLMSQLIDNPDRRQRMGKAAHVSATLSTWDNTVEVTLRAYAYALGQSRQGNSVVYFSNQS